MRTPERESTRHNKERFLRVFEKTLWPTAEICRSLGISRTAVHYWRRDDAEFAAALRLVRDKIVEDAENVVLRSALGSDHVAAMQVITKVDPTGDGGSGSLRRQDVPEPRPKRPNRRVKGPEPLDPLLPGGL